VPPVAMVCKLINELRCIILIRYGTTVGAAAEVSRSTGDYGATPHSSLDHDAHPSFRLISVGRQIERPDGPRLWAGRSAQAQNRLGFRVSCYVCWREFRDKLGILLATGPAPILYKSRGIRPI
jgi:hypothetical protein